MRIASDVAESLTMMKGEVLASLWFAGSLPIDRAMLQNAADALEKAIRQLTKHCVEYTPTPESPVT